MCRLFETIRVVNRKPDHLPFHERRMNASRLALFGAASPVSLTGLILTDGLSEGEYKCKVIYRQEVEGITFEPYVRKNIRNVAMVDGSRLSYSHKYLDRSAFKDAFRRHPGFDELIFVRNGFLTDSSFSNLAFFDGKIWYTPSAPLLPGTRLIRLLEAGMIIPKAITPRDISSFTSLSFVNAMLEPGKSTVSINQIQNLTVL